MTINPTSAVVQIFAADVTRSVAFYRLLGLPLPDPEGPDPHVSVDLPGGNKLSIDAEQTISGMHPEWTPPSAAGRVAPAFGFSSSAEVDAAFGTLTDAGNPGPLAPYDAPWGQRYASVLDPDGNLVDLFAPLQ